MSIKNLTIKLFTLIFFTMFLLAFKTEIVTAQSTYCNSIKGQIQRGADPSHRYNGSNCSTPGDYNKNKTCRGATGARYTVYYCVPLPDADPTFDCVTHDCSAVGCEVEYPEDGDKAPAYCNRPDPGAATDISKIFGEILPPQAIQNFGFGALGISKFLSNLILLIYSIASIALIFMLLWGAFEWLTSGGEKEKVASAQARLTYAFIGIILFAVAFAVIQVLGAFTGFKFFAGQN